MNIYKYTITKDQKRGPIIWYNYYLSMNYDIESAWEEFRSVLMLRGALEENIDNIDLVKDHEATISVYNNGFFEDITIDEYIQGGHKNGFMGGTNKNIK